MDAKKNRVLSHPKGNNEAIIFFFLFFNDNEEEDKASPRESLPFPPPFLFFISFFVVGLLSLTIYASMSYHSTKKREGLWVDEQDNCELKLLSNWTDSKRPFGAQARGLLPAVFILNQHSLGLLTCF